MYCSQHSTRTTPDTYPRGCSLTTPGGLEGQPSLVCFSDGNWVGNWGTVQKEEGSQTLPSGATKREIIVWKCHSLPWRRKGRNLSLTLLSKSLTDPFTAQVTTLVKLSKHRQRKSTFEHSPTIPWPQEQRQNGCLKCFFHTWTFTSLKSEMHKSGPVAQSTRLNHRGKKSSILRVYVNMIYIRE